ncbi:protein of unknown function [Pseudomonas sp. JV241A]|nr:protein of unknown function [Pseudomonas sp. JV241A]
MPAIERAAVVIQAPHDVLAGLASSRGKLNWPNDFGHLRRALLWRPIGGKISAKILLERIQNQSCRDGAGRW